MPSTAVIVTSCTLRKAERNRIDVAQLPDATSLNQLVRTWRRTICKAEANIQAGRLYQGRAIVDTAAVAEILGTSWYVVSAGLGLVRSELPVPAYECTVAAGSELHRRLRALGCSPAHWWNELTNSQPAPLSRVIARAPTLLALPSSYIRMVYDDLARVAPARTRHLRIFTSAAGALCVPNHLKGCVMPYDERLEAVRRFSGTQSDFAQRALRHFVEVLQATSLPLEKARDAVSASLAHRRRRRRQVGQRMTDNEIQQVLVAQWTRHSGSSTKLLRYLRDEAHISCEQKRFSRLWRAVSVQLES